jgi:hypothetical protein
MKLTRFSTFPNLLFMKFSESFKVPDKQPTPNYPRITNNKEYG